MRRGCRHGLLSAAFALSACVSTGGTGPFPDLVWPSPPELPRVRLERILVTDRDTGKARGVLSVLSGGEAAQLFERPYGVAWVGDDLFVTDPAAGRVVAIGADGRVRKTPAGLLDGPMGVAAWKGGIVVTEPALGRLSFVPADLSRRETIEEGLSRPTGVTSASRDLFVLETGAHAIRFFRTDGRTGTWGRRGTAQGEYNYPASISGSGDSLFVGDTLNFRVQRIDARSGASTGSFGGLGDAAGETPRIKGIGIDSKGLVWVTDALLDQVALFDQEGSYLLTIGGTGDGPGQFRFPAGIAGHPDGRVAVVDSLGGRVQVFRVLASGGTNAP